MSYEPIPPISREEAEAVFVQDDPHAVLKALLGLALWDPDGHWVEQQCFRFSEHPDSDVRGAVPLCLMHIARLHGVLDVDVSLPLLESLQTDSSPWVAGRATEMLADIKWILFGIPVCLPTVRPQELQAELAALNTLEWVTSILQDASAPLTRPVPATVSAERQLALFREAFDMMRQHFALLGIGATEQPADDSGTA